MVHEPQILYAVSAIRFRSHSGVVCVPRGKFRGVSLHKGLLDEVDELVEASGRYRTTTEFVNEAVRLRLEMLQRQYGLGDCEPSESIVQETRVENAKS